MAHGPEAHRAFSRSQGMLGRFLVPSGAVDARSRHARPDLRRVRTAGRLRPRLCPGLTAVTFDLVAFALTFAGIAAYLLLALLRPERF